MQLTKVETEAVKTLYIIWKSIDFKKMSAGRLMRIWGEFEGKVKMASYKPTAELFLDFLKKKFGIAVIKNPEILEFLKDDVLKNIRKNSVKLILVLRGIIEIEKAEYKKLKDTKQEKKYFKKSCDELLKSFIETEDKTMEISEGINIADEWEAFLND